MKTWKKIFFVMIVSVIFFAPSLVKASSVYDGAWNPPNVKVTKDNPYYFPITLPEWDFERGDYSEATFDLTYLDQIRKKPVNIYIYAADPANDTSEDKSYNILLGTVHKAKSKRNKKRYNSNMAQFDFLANLSEADFDALFQNQSILYLVADADYRYIFDKAVLHLEANNKTSPVPVPGAAWLLASGFIGLAGVRRKIAKA